MCFPVRNPGYIGGRTSVGPSELPDPAVDIGLNGPSLSREEEYNHLCVFKVAWYPESRYWARRIREEGVSEIHSGGAVKLNSPVL